jgi:hypothetical protein
MRIMDVIFIGLMFMMTISLVAQGHLHLERKIKEVKSVCKESL